MSLLITDECINCDVCPVDYIPMDPGNEETHDELFLKYKALMG